MGLFPKLIFFGDSLTQYGANLTEKGWIAQLREQYSLKADLIARGFSGYNTEWVKPLFSKMIAQDLSSDDEVCIVTILLGSNDSSLVHRQQHVPLDKYKENIGNMVEAIKKASPNVLIFLVTPPPIDETACEAKDRQSGVTTASRSISSVRQYADAIVSLGEEKQVHVINLWEGFFLKAELFTDGLHLSEEGNTLLAQKWLEGIHTYCPDLSPESLPLVASHWSEMKKFEIKS